MNILQIITIAVFFIYVLLITLFLTNSLHKLIEIIEKVINFFTKIKNGKNGNEKN